MEIPQIDTRWRGLVRSITEELRIADNEIIPFKQILKTISRIVTETSSTSRIILTKSSISRIISTNTLTSRIISTKQIVSRIIKYLSIIGRH